MLQEILKELDLEAEKKVIARYSGDAKEVIITLTLDSHRDYLHYRDAKIIKAVCEEMTEKIKKSIDNSEKESSELECSQDGYECGLEKAKQLIEETKL